MNIPIPYDPKMFGDNAYLDLLPKLSRNYEAELQLLSFDFANYFSGQYRNDILDKIIHSLNMRNNSLHFHHLLISSSKVESTEYLDTGRIIQIKTEKLFLFDSFIFNMASSIDYFACLVYYLITTSQDYKRTWKKVYTFLGSKASFKDHELKNEYYRFHNWINKLVDYRANLVHYEIDNSAFSASTDLMKGKTTLQVQPPNNFTNKFKEFNVIDKQDKNIEQVSYWLLLNHTETLIQLSKLLQKYILDNKKGDFQVITFK